MRISTIGILVQGNCRWSFARGLVVQHGISDRPSSVCRSNAASGAFVRMEMLATGTTCSLNHSVTVTTPDIVRAAVEPQTDLGIGRVSQRNCAAGHPDSPIIR